MKKIFALSIAGSLLLVPSLAACSSGESAPVVTVTQTAPAPTQEYTPEPEPQMSNEEIYLTTLRSMNNPLINSSSDRDLLDAGYAVCDALQAGFSIEEIISYLAQQMVVDGINSESYTQAVGYILGASESVLCRTVF